MLSTKNGIVYGWCNDEKTMNWVGTYTYGTIEKYPNINFKLEHGMYCNYGWFLRGETRGDVEAQYADDKKNIQNMIASNNAKVTRFWRDDYFDNNLWDDDQYESIRDDWSEPCDGFILQPTTEVLHNVNRRWWMNTEFAQDGLKFAMETYRYVFVSERNEARTLDCCCEKEVCICWTGDEDCCENHRECRKFYDPTMQSNSDYFFSNDKDILEKIREEIKQVQAIYNE